jgi:Mg2+-importing ATPase
MLRAQVPDHGAPGRGPATAGRPDAAAIAREPADALCARLGTSPRGLMTREAERRLLESGFNESESAAIRSTLHELLRVTLNPLNVILLAAGIGAAVLGQTVDAVIIASMVLLGSGLYFWQTFRSNRAVRDLHAQVAPTAMVLRDGRWGRIARRTLVVGDIIQLSAGDLVPADARLLRTTDLHVQQAALTGESMPAEKDANLDTTAGGAADAPNLVFLGTSVVSGTGSAVVFATGSQTAFGEVVERLAARPDETEFERGARKFAMLILRTVVLLVAFVLIANLTLGRDPFQSLLFSVALAVGLTPEFLPMITTVTLAQGAIRMAREKVIVRHLPAIQNLGSIDILCTDKTGTLTEGAMSVEESLGPFGAADERALRLAALNSHFQTGLRSPLDEAILARGSADTAGYTKTDEVPFDFERRRLSIVLRGEHAMLLVTKGAPEGVLAACTSLELDGVRQPLDADALERCTDTFHQLSQRGLRVLAVACKDVDRSDGFRAADECELTFIGFVTFSDPLLEGVSECISVLARDGVRVKILSGDNELVTAHVCAQAGLTVERVVLGSEVSRMDEVALARSAEQYDVFARLSPVQKHRIIHALKTRGHVVGFMGDGINDAPSLHGADVGISVAGAVDIAREAADIVLLERRLDVLHAGILAGRRSFGNVLKYLMMGTSSNFGNMVSMAAATLWLPFLPMRPTQILLNNFLYDMAQVTIPTDNVDPQLIRRPQRWDMRLIRSFMVVIGPVSSLYDFLTFFVLLRVFAFAEPRFQTGWFVESLTTQTLVLFVIRTVGKPWANRPSTALAITTLLSVAIGMVLPYTPLGALFGLYPLPGTYFLFLTFVTATYLVVVQFVKARLMRRLVQASVT